MSTGGYYPPLQIPACHSLLPRRRAKPVQVPRRFRIKSSISREPLAVRNCSASIIIRKAQTAAAKSAKRRSGGKSRGRNTPSGTKSRRFPRKLIQAYRRSSSLQPGEENAAIDLDRAQRHQIEARLATFFTPEQEQQKPQQIQRKERRIGAALPSLFLHVSFSDCAAGRGCGRRAR